MSPILDMLRILMNDQLHPSWSPWRNRGRLAERQPSPRKEIGPRLQRDSRTTVLQTRPATPPRDVTCRFLTSRGIGIKYPWELGTILSARCLPFTRKGTIKALNLEIPTSPFTPNLEFVSLPPTCPCLWKNANSRAPASLSLFLTHPSTSWNNSA